jgi:hypothetical protein
VEEIPFAHFARGQRVCVKSDAIRFRLRSIQLFWTYSWPGVRDILCRDLALLSTKMGDGIVGDRSDFGISVGRRRS